ncbi:hypothetical protein OS127_03025 [Corynebacterium sp. P6129]|nr:hypothetical protein [Corynebacterium antarcticum]MCX7491501.1 hypothetical protein [Corynebacterium antarcticum]
MTYRVEPPAPEPDSLEIIASALLIGIATVIVAGVLGLLLFEWVVS